MQDIEPFMQAAGFDGGDSDGDCFQEMTTRYRLESEDEVTATATTEFALEAGLVGPILDADEKSAASRRDSQASHTVVRDSVPLSFSSIRDSDRETVDISHLSRT